MSAVTVRKPRKAERERDAADQEQAAIWADRCNGCPYRACMGATATLSYEEMVERSLREALA